MDLAATDVHDQPYRRLHARLDELCARLVRDSRLDPESWSAADLNSAQSSLEQLSQGRDADYTLTAIGRLYASWYHLRRTRVACQSMAIALRKLPEVTCIIDLGCGTGAVAWALALIGKPLQYVGIDRSQPMLSWAKLMWDGLRNSGLLSDAPTAAWREDDAMSCEDLSPGASARSLVTMSHLHDHSTDRALDRERERFPRRLTTWRALGVLASSTTSKLGWTSTSTRTLNGLLGASSHSLRLYTATDDCPRLANARETLDAVVHPRPAAPWSGTPILRFRELHTIVGMPRADVTEKESAMFWDLRRV